MKKLYKLVIGCFMVLQWCSMQATAQTAISGTQWQTHGASTTGSSAFTTLPATTTPGATVVAISQWSRGSVTYNAAGTSYNSNNWELGTTLAAAQASNSCVYFTITNNSTTEVEVTNVTVESQVSATGPTVVQMQYAIGSGTDQNFGTAVSTAHTATPETFVFNGVIHLCASQTATVKLYGWAAGSAAGTLRINTATSIRADFVTAVTASATNSGPICVGSNLNFNATATNGTTPYTYSWSGPGTFSSTRSNPFITGATTAASGIYTVAITDGYGCTDVATTNATMNATPVPTVTPTGAAQVCPGGTLTMTTLTGMNYRWSESGTPIAGATNNSYTTSTVGIFRVTVTDPGTGCSATSASTIVTIAPAPTASISAASATTFCAGGSVVLSATVGGGYTYEWYNGATRITGATNSTYSATTTGNYYAIVFNAGLCFDTSNTIAVTVNPLPSNTVTPSGPLTFCVGSNVVLTATAATGNTYQWYVGSVTIPGATNVAYTATTSGTYRVIVTNTFGCTSTSANFTVTANTAPSAALTYSGPTTFCTGGNVIVTAPSGGGLSYQWYNGTTAITGATNSSRLFNVTGTYAVVVRNATGCTTRSVDINVYVVPVPFIAVTGATTFCNGNSVLLRVNTGTVAVPGLSYQWKLNTVNIPGATAVDYAATLPGSYTCFVNVPGSCAVTTAAVPVTVRPAVVPVVTYNAVTNTLSTQSFYTSYQWYINTISISGATTNTYRPTLVGNYRVRVIDSNGCSLLSDLKDIFKLAVEDIASDITASIYPNPVADVLNIECTRNVNVTIISIDGKVVMQANDTKQVDVHALTAGLYIISLTDEQHRAIGVHRMIKQ